MQQFQAVGKRASGADDLDEIGLETLDSGVDRFEIDLLFVIVEADEQGGVGLVQSLDFESVALLGRLDFNVHDGETGFGGRGEDVQLVHQRAGKSATELFAPAGGNGHHFPVRGEEFSDRGDGAVRPFAGAEAVEAELQELRLGQGSFGACEQLGNGAAADGDADPSNPGSEVGGGRDGGQMRHTAIAAS